MRYLALIGLLLCSSLARADALPDPETIRDSIRRSGARDAVRAMSDDQIDAIEQRIGQGSARWVALAPLLAPGTDAGSSEGLGIALATALASNPVAVLRAIGPDDAGPIGSRRVCGVPFIESAPGVDEAYVVKAIAAVQGVTAPQYRKVRAKCLKELHRSDDALHHRRSR